MVQSSDFYKRLEVSKSASSDEIKKAYRKKALQWHPDKNVGNQDVAEKKFQDISEAYEVLSDAEKRKIYDQYGEAGLRGEVPSDGGTATGPSAADFGGGMPFNFPGGHHRSSKMGGMGPNMGFHFQASDPSKIFEQFFGTANPRDAEQSSMFGHSMFPGGSNGLHHSRQKQARPRPSYTTIECSLEQLYMGDVKKLKISRRVGDHMEEKILEVPIKSGWKTGTKITYAGEGDCLFGQAPQDIVLVVKEKEHEKFTRKGNDLIYTATIALKDALLGQGTLPITTLDGRTILININNVITPESKHVFPGEGMPLQKYPSRRGDLIVHFKLRFPTQLSEEQKRKLKDALE